MNNEINQNYEEEISLKELILVLVKEKKLVTIITVVTTIFAIIFTFMLPSVYEAQSQVVFSIPEEKGTRFGVFVFPSQNVQDYLPLLNSLDVKKEVAQIMGLDSTEEVQLTYNFNEKNKYVEISTQASSPELAKQLNDNVASTYINRIRAQYKQISMENFTNSLKNSITSLDYSKLVTQSMLKEKEAFLLELDPVYTLQKALFADPKAAALYADKFGLDLGSLSNDVVIEEFVNQKYLQIQAEAIDLKTSLINISEALKFNNILLEELLAEKEMFTKQIASLEYDDALNDELDILNGSILQVHEATLPLTKVSPRNSINVAIGLVMGLFLGVFVAFFKHYWKSIE